MHLTYFRYFAIAFDGIPFLVEKIQSKKQMWDKLDGAVLQLSSFTFFWIKPLKSFSCLQIFYILTEFDEKVVEELSVEVLAHLVEDEPVADGAVGDVAADHVQVLASLEVPVN